MEDTGKPGLEWSDPMAVSFTVVGVLFVVCVVLGIFNLYISYLQKKKVTYRHFTEGEGGSGKPLANEREFPVAESHSPRDGRVHSAREVGKRTHMQLNMSSRNLQGIKS